MDEMSLGKAWENVSNRESSEPNTFEAIRWEKSLYLQRQTSFTHMPPKYFNILKSTSTFSQVTTSYGGEKKHLFDLVFGIQVVGCKNFFETVLNNQNPFDALIDNPPLEFLVPETVIQFRQVYAKALHNNLAKR